jgi:hypothetical protein
MGAPEIAPRRRVAVIGYFSSSDDIGKWSYSPAYLGAGSANAMPRKTDDARTVFAIFILAFVLRTMIFTP